MIELNFDNWITRVSYRAHYNSSAVKYGFFRVLFRRRDRFVNNVIPQ